MWTPTNMQIRENISLKPWHTFGTEAVAKYFAQFSTEEELLELLDFARNPMAKLVLGGGSNVLFTHDFNGLVLRNEIQGIRKVNEDDDHYYVRVGAGESWHLFVMHCVEHDFFGVENLALIPGHVGASPMQNIGAYGVELKDVFHSLEAIHVNSLDKVILAKDDCAFGYRESVFKNKFKDLFVITHVTFKLRKSPVFNISYGAIAAELEKMHVSGLTARNIAEAVMRIRRSKLPDPAVTGNAGSFFKNPEVDVNRYEELRNAFPGLVAYPAGPGRMKLAAGWLIEQCGWKGYRQGDAGCHPAQALVLVNYGNASGAEIIHLAQRIQNDVWEKFGVRLQTEVNII